MTRPVALIVLAAVLLPVVAVATTVGGGGSSKTDCLAVFEADVNTPASRPRDIRCADGDPCDLDGEVNGSCQFAVAVCINSTFDPRCTANGVQSVTVDHALDNGDPKFDPEFQALQTRIDSAFDLPSSDSGCAIATNFTVPVEGPLAGGVCRKTRKTVRVVTLSTPAAGTGKVTKDKDTIKLTCDPAPAGCDPAAFYTGTYDRIQKQVFNQSCALSSCHDSQSHQANMVLEDSASYTSIVGVTPTNAAAAGDGWQRIMPGDSTQSFLYRKITHDLPSGAYGSPMPLIGPNVDPHLIDIIRLWIEAGAPQTGWVPGTDS